MIGWREIVSLPELGLTNVHAKIDTGARTTALHASHIHTFEEAGSRWVEFLAPRMPGMKPQRCRLPIQDERAVKNTSGVPEPRIIVRTTLILLGRKWPIDLSLADRSEMTFPVIIGRSAIRGRRILVDSGRSYLTGNPHQLSNEHKIQRNHL